MSYLLPNAQHNPLNLNGTICGTGRTPRLIGRGGVLAEAVGSKLTPDTPPMITLSLCIVKIASLFTQHHQRTEPQENRMKSKKMRGGEEILMCDVLSSNQSQRVTAAPWCDLRLQPSNQC